MNCAASATCPSGAKTNQPTMTKRIAIGIDLGTTYSCVGVFRDGKVEIIINERGSRITPSYVAFTDQEQLVGDSARAQRSVNPKNTVFEVKRLIGRKFADATVQEDIKQWPFEVFDDHGAPKIKVQFKKEEKNYVPEQISAMVLKKMKTIAEAKIGQEVHDAVITVPAFFNDSQRQATIAAGKIAGLNVLSIINEPTAAALAYGFEKKAFVDQTIFVFDLGGGTFDAVVLSINGKNYQVKAVGGDTHLGGGDFDSRLVDHCLKILARKYGRDISQDQKALSRLRKSCEDAKICLSGEVSASIDIACLFDGENFQVKITRKRFEELCSDLFQKIIEHVKGILLDAAVNKSEIDEVILVGGSSRIPKIKELLSKFFDGKKLNATINPDEAVAYGAAVKAALASEEDIIEITLADVVPLSLGMECQDDVMEWFIKRNTRIPVAVVQSNWTTRRDNQTSVTVNVYEGERTQASSNNLLGTFNFEIGEEEKEGVPKLTFTFEVDDNGILHVSGVNRKTNCSGSVTITSNRGCLANEDIKKMVQEARQSEGGVRPLEDAGPSKEALETFCLNQKEKTRMNWKADKVSLTERDQVLSWCDEVLDWLDDNNNLEKLKYDLKLLELKFKCSNVID